MCLKVNFEASLKHTFLGVKEPQVQRLSYVMKHYHHKDLQGLSLVVIIYFFSFIFIPHSHSPPPADNHTVFHMYSFISIHSCKNAFSCFVQSTWL